MVKRIDWEGAENDWRIGKLTQEAIAKKYGCSAEAMRKRFKKYEITRDLTETVKMATKAALIAKAKLTPTQIGEKVGEELGLAQLSGIEAAVSENVRIIESHRTDIAGLKALALEMARELHQVTGQQEDLETLIQKVGADNPTAAAILQKMTSLPRRIQCAEKLASVLSKLIPLERQAHNIDDERSQGGVYEKLLAEVLAEDCNQA